MKIVKNEQNKRNIILNIGFNHLILLVNFKLNYLYKLAI